MAYVFILAAILARLLPHPWNVTPVGAMFLFSGAVFRRKLVSLAVPLAALLASDFAVDRIIYHGQYGWFSPYTWAGFLLVGVIGWTLRARVTAVRVPVASLAGSAVFFLVSNFGVWATSTLYSRTTGGLVECYVAGLPFFRNTILGDLAYAALMFGCYEWIRHRQRVAASCS